MEFPIGLIIYRIWRCQRLVEPARRNSALLPVMIMVVESGAVYSTALISVVITFSTGHSAQYVLLDFVRSVSLLSRLVLNHIILFILQLPSLMVSTFLKH
jgi:hypothetical protein